MRSQEEAMEKIKEFTVSLPDEGGRNKSSRFISFLLIFNLSGSIYEVV